jgi:hypothetical protein
MTVAIKKGSVLQEYLDVVNSPDGMNEFAFVKASKLAIKLTDSELLNLKQMLIAGNTGSDRHVYIEVLSGLIEELIRKKRLTGNNVAPLATSGTTKSAVTLSGKVFPFMVSEHHQSNDRGLKRRMLKDKQLAPLSLPKLFGRYMKTKKQAVDAELIGVNMVEKIGEGWLLNGLIIKVSDEDKRGCERLLEHDVKPAL